MKRFTNYWKYTRSISFMFRIIFAGILIYLQKIVKSDKLLVRASNICKKEYIFNTPFGKYIGASLYGYTQMHQNYGGEVGKIIHNISEKLQKDNEKYLLNIGCNIGRYAVDLAYNYGFNVIAFEPAPETYYRFTTNVTFSGLQDKIECYNIGLGDENGMMNFQYNIKDNGCAHVVNDDNSLNRQDIIQVPIGKFDDLGIDIEKLRKTRLIIMDVEGFEYQALKGMEMSLKKFQNIDIIVEIREHQKSKRKTINFMENLGYSVEKIGDEDYRFSK